ncbi:hypothetical protein BDY21DRAFT_209419 [Lineolata rhizophorae]|uniref:Uncharacterized protein n=1 Tax=Lineolata rhizophorae TaxID=578093 RepID=A0A6A6P4G7_9PEZI|nr:hypothetical protein BDY21DRAFT_209419 [Lineolata rhizophorae]
MLGKFQAGGSTERPKGSWRLTLPLHPSHGRMRRDQGRNPARCCQAGLCRIASLWLWFLLSKERRFLLKQDTLRLCLFPFFLFEIFFFTSMYIIPRSYSLCLRFLYCFLLFCGFSMGFRRKGRKSGGAKCVRYR